MPSVVVREARLRVLGRAVRALAAAPVDYDDPAAEAAYYSAAGELVAAVLATPAATLQGLQVKADAVAWCCASRTHFGLGGTSSELLIASILQDLLADAA